jgi:hypothetical protein
VNQQWIQDVHTRANKATPGPWCNVKKQSEIIGTCFEVRTAGDYPRSIASALVFGSDKALEQVEADFEFLARARTDVPQLLRLAEEMAEELQRVRHILLQSDCSIMEWPNGTLEIEAIAESRAVERIEALIAKYRGEVNGNA